MNREPLCENEAIFLWCIVLRRLLLVIAGATQQELARQVQYLTVENQILRSKLPARMPVTEKEKKRLVRIAANVGQALN
jgi:putative transposase